MERYKFKSFELPFYLDADLSNSSKIFKTFTDIYSVEGWDLSNRSEIEQMMNRGFIDYLVKNNSISLSDGSDLWRKYLGGRNFPRDDIKNELLDFWEQHLTGEKGER